MATGAHHACTYNCHRCYHRKGTPNFPPCASRPVVFPLLPCAPRVVCDSFHVILCKGISNHMRRHLWEVLEQEDQVLLKEIVSGLPSWKQEDRVRPQWLSEANLQASEVEAVMRVMPMLLCQLPGKRNGNAAGGAVELVDFVAHYEHCVHLMLTPPPAEKGTNAFKERVVKIQKSIVDLHLLGDRLQDRFAGFHSRVFCLPKWHYFVSHLSEDYETLGGLHVANGKIGEKAHKPLKRLWSMATNMRGSDPAVTLCHHLNALHRFSLQLPETIVKPSLSRNGLCVLHGGQWYIWERGMRFHELEEVSLDELPANRRTFFHLGYRFVTKKNANVEGTVAARETFHDGWVHYAVPAVFKRQGRDCHGLLLSPFHTPYLLSFL